MTCPDTFSHGAGKAAMVLATPKDLANGGKRKQEVLA